VGNAKLMKMGNAEKQQSSCGNDWRCDSSVAAYLFGISFYLEEFPIKILRE